MNVGYRGGQSLLVPRRRRALASWHQGMTLARLVFARRAQDAGCAQVGRAVARDLRLYHVPRPVRSQEALQAASTSNSHSGCGFANTSNLETNDDSSLTNA